MPKPQQTYRAIKQHDKVSNEAHDAKTKTNVAIRHDIDSDSNHHILAMAKKYRMQAANIARMISDLQKRYKDLEGTHDENAIGDLTRILLKMNEFCEKLVRISKKHHINDKSILKVLPIAARYNREFKKIRRSLRQVAQVARSSTAMVRPPGDRPVTRDGTPIDLSGIILAIKISLIILLIFAKFHKTHRS